MAHKPSLPSLVLFLVLLPGEPGYVIPEEQLPLANHVVEVTAFVADSQIGSTEVTVPTCKLTAISPLTRESVHFCQSPGICVCVCVRVCVCACVCVSESLMHHFSVCLSACKLKPLLTPVLQSLAAADPFNYYHCMTSLSFVPLCRPLLLGIWFCSV